MNNEIQKEQKDLNLGVNVHQDLTSTNEIKTENDSYFGKPEKYDYSQIELPENYCYDQELLNEFNELAGKYNLSQKSANELMSMAVKLTKLMGTNYSKTMVEQQRQKIENYRHNLVNDREIGGAQLDKTMQTANVAYKKFASDEVQNLLSETGLNCHPQVVKMFYNIGQQMQDDNLLGVNSPAFHKENREDILFPTM